MVLFKREEMRPYRIPVTFAVTGEYEVYASNLKKAVAIAYDRELPEYQQPIEDSFAVDVGQIPVRNRDSLSEDDVNWALQHEGSYSDQILRSAKED